MLIVPLFEDPNAKLPPHYPLRPFWGSGGTKEQPGQLMDSASNRLGFVHGPCPGDPGLMSAVSFRIRRTEPSKLDITVSGGKQANKPYGADGESRWQHDHWRSI